jgi:hypothetical protein
MSTLLVVMAAIASMLLAGRMAQVRDRSITMWVWIAAAVGPFGPLAFYLLGSRNQAARTS